MTAEADVIPNELYHIKLVVADDQDTAYDSAVFISAGSFDIGDLDLGEDILLDSGDALCQGQEMILDAGGLPNNSSISWFMDGNLIEGANDVTITVSETAFYSANIVINGTDCTFADEILVEFFPVPNVIAVDDNIIKCANEDYLLEVEVTNSDELNSLTYYWSIDGIDVQVGPDSTYNLDDVSEEFGEFTVSVFDDNTSCWSSTTINVTVDDTLPTIEAPVNVSVSTNEGCTATGVNLGFYYYDDNCTVSIITNDAPESYDVGETTVTWTVTDSSGNTATATQTVTVTDDTLPTIEAPADINSCVNENIDLGNAAISDNCTVSSITNDAPSVYTEITTTVTWTVTDSSGNIATATQLVTMINALSPTAICNDISLTLEEGIAVISALDLDDGSYDECGEVELSISQTEFDESHIGDNTVILTVTDNSGNTSTCEATVSVEAGLDTEENYLINSISIYPNPTSEKIFIKSNFSCDYEIFNMIGQKIISGRLMEGTNEVSLREYSNGVYFINITNDNKLYTKKIILNK
jgi:hypothetical protein